MLDHRGDECGESMERKTLAISLASLAEGHGGPRGGFRVRRVVRRIGTDHDEHGSIIAV